MPLHVCQITQKVKGGELMRKKIPIVFGFIFVFVFVLAATLTLSTSAYADTCACCLIMCETNPNKLACEGHLVSGLGCVCAPCEECEGIAHTCLD